MRERAERGGAGLDQVGDVRSVRRRGCQANVPNVPRARVAETDELPASAGVIRDVGVDQAIQAGESGRVARVGRNQRPMRDVPARVGDVHLPGIGMRSE